MEEKEQLEVKKATYARLKALTDQAGWQDFLNMVESEYYDALDILKSPQFVSQECEARGILKFIDHIMERIDSELSFGKVATDKYISKYINKTLKED